MIRSTGGFIFGGFADKPWTSTDKYFESDKAFLFSLKSPSNEVGLTKMRIKQNMCCAALGHSSYYGLTFGGGHDLCIESDTNNNSTSSSYLGQTYEIPHGQTNTFWVGSKYFKVSDIEVFQVI